MAPIPKRKRGRPPMPAGNPSRKRQKLFRLSADTIEMLTQASTVLGITESDYAEKALRREFMRDYSRHRDTFGESFWNQALERARQPQRLKLR